MLHRKRELLKISFALLLLLSIPGGAAWSQIRQPLPDSRDEQPRPAARKKVKGPRALGVIEIAPSGKARLQPIAILIGDKWYDAGLYMASPRPMALEPETVYEGEKNGEPEGLFTITATQQVNGNWVGLGTWKPKGSEQAPKKVVAAKPASVANAEDERPVLRRPKPAPASTASSTSTTATVPASTQSPAPATAPTTPSVPEKKQAENNSTAPPVRTEEDDRRPVLRRGKPGVEQAADIAMPSSPDDFAPGPPSKTPADAQRSVGVRRLAAISDAGGPEPRCYVFHTNPGEREDFIRRMTDLASQSLRKFMETRARGVPVPAVTNDNSQLQIFDLTSNNEPVLVLTSRVPAWSAGPVTTVRKVGAPQSTTAAPPQSTASSASPGGLEYYITVVARVDVTGDMRKLFDSVTDSTRLDAFARLDLIDAVDANGDNNGELLFRETYDRSRSYVIYRVGMDQLWQLFEGAQTGF